MSFVNLDKVMNMQAKPGKGIFILIMFLAVLRGNLIVVPESLAEGQRTNAESGRHLYNERGCYTCHGFEGQGALITGSRIAPDPLPVEAFAIAVRRPRNVMPAYSPAVLSDTELESIHYFLTTIPQAPALNKLQIFSKDTPK